MNLRPRRREEPEINLVPMIDVVLVLLIFFMIATSLRHAAELDIRLPEASGKPMPGDVAHLEVDIDAAGRYAVNGRSLAAADAATLKESLKETLLAETRGRALPLTVSADGRTPHQAVVTVLDIAGQLGIRQLAIATAGDSSPPQPAARSAAPPPSDYSTGDSSPPQPAARSAAPPPSDYSTGDSGSPQPAVGSAAPPPPDR